jgi:hypothetical protein
MDCPKCGRPYAYSGHDPRLQENESWDNVLKARDALAAALKRIVSGWALPRAAVDVAVKAIDDYAPGGRSDEER